MAESIGLARHHPLEGRETALAVAGVTVLPYVAMVDVRGAGVPVEPNTWATVENGRAIWLGPDEWLVTSDAGTPEELVARVGGTDVSAQRITLRLGGSHAREVLAKGCSVDLHPRVFTAGRCAQTVLGQAGVVLLALGDDEYLVLVRSSFAAYLADWLLDASLEYA